MAIRIELTTTPRIVVIMAVQWGIPGDEVCRWFQINPYNHSGKRLINIIGHNNFIVTNACSDLVYDARDQGTPNPTWLRANLRTLCPDLVIVCGAVANATFERGMVPKHCKVLAMPHPAARTWTKAAIAATTTKVRRAIMRLPV
jgi:hypothetical protein